MCNSLLTSHQIYWERYTCPSVIILMRHAIFLSACEWMRLRSFLKVQVKRGGGFRKPEYLEKKPKWGSNPWPPTLVLRPVGQNNVGSCSNPLSYHPLLPLCTNDIWPLLCPFLGLGATSHGWDTKKGGLEVNTWSIREGEWETDNHD